MVIRIIVFIQSIRKYSPLNNFFFREQIFLIFLFFFFDRFDEHFLIRSESLVMLS